MKKRRSKPTGDTIVEVLIAIAIVALVLAGAYRIASHSLQAVRDAEEHSIALKYAQGQMEQLQSAAPNMPPPPTIFTTPTSPFCMDSSGTIGGPCVITNGIDYTISDTRVGSATQAVFKVQVTWPSIEDSSIAQVSLSYKLDN